MSPTPKTDVQEKESQDKRQNQQESTRKMVQVAMTKIKNEKTNPRYFNSAQAMQTLYRSRL